MVSFKEVIEALEDSTVVEVFKTDDGLWLIRKKKAEVNAKIKFLGFDSDGIRNLTIKQLNEFMKQKEWIESLLL